MVHALEKIKNCLAPGGFLIDIRPAGEMPPLFVRDKAGQSLIGWIGETDYFVEYQQADAAIAQSVTAGVFRMEDHQEFIFETLAGDITGLRDYLQGTWSDAVLQDMMLERAARLQSRASGSSTIVLVERVQIIKLVPR